MAWKQRQAHRPPQPHRPPHGSMYMVQDGTGQGSHHRPAPAVAAGGVTAAIGGLLATRQHADGRCALPSYPKLSPLKQEATAYPATTTTSAQYHQGMDAIAVGRRETQARVAARAGRGTRESLGRRRRRTMTLMQVDGSRVSVPSSTHSPSSSSSPTQQHHQNGGSPRGLELLAPLREKPARRRVGGAGFQASAQKYAEVSVVPEAALPRPWHGVRALPRHTGVLSIKRGFHGAF